MKKIVSTLLILFVFANSIIAIADDPEEGWKDIKIQVAAITGLGDQFFRSVRIFSKESSPYQGDDCKVINGDSLDEINGSKVVHVKGSLGSDVTLEDHSELIVGKDVMPDVNIYVNGMTRIFIGGDFKGRIIAKSSYTLHVIGSHFGVITTGRPSSRIIIHGDFKGKLHPNEANGGLASIEVYGYTDVTAIKAIYSHKYTQLNGAFHNSNVAPGIYQTNPLVLKLYTVVNRVE